MEIILRYSEGCPHRATAESRLREALGDRSIPIRLEQVDGPEKAERTGFQGSPTILVDGRDPFADPTGRIGFSCRLYRTGDGLEGSPSVAQLREVLR